MSGNMKKIVDGTMKASVPLTKAQHRYLTDRMNPYPQRRARVRKVGDTWTTTYTGGHLAPMILHWTDHKIALQQALAWVGLLNR